MAKKQFSYQRRGNESISIRFLVVLAVFSLAFPGARAQAQKSYIIVHAHNPEGIEIASIEGMPPNCVQVYDGGNLIAYGAKDAESHNRATTISPGPHTIKGIFNGMTKEQALTLKANEKKSLTFTFDRTDINMEPIFTRSGKAYGSRSEKHTGGWGEKSISVWASERGEIIGSVPIMDGLIGYGYAKYYDSGIQDRAYTITHYAQMSYRLTPELFYVEGFSTITSAPLGEVSTRSIAGEFQFLYIDVASIFNKNFPFENWYAQNIVPGYNPQEIAGGAAIGLIFENDPSPGPSWWAFVPNCYPFNIPVSGGYYNQVIEAKPARWLKLCFGIGYIYTNWPESDAHSSVTKKVPAKDIKFSSVPYDLTGTGIGGGETKPPAVTFLDKENPGREIKGATADGAAVVEIRIKNLPPQIAIDKINIGLTDARDGRLENDAKIGNNVFSQTYTAPMCYARDGKPEDISKGMREIGLTVKVNGREIPHPDFFITKPPVVLLHGLWSDNTGTWFHPNARLNLVKRLKTDHGYPYVLPFEYRDSVSLDQLTNVVGEAVNDALVLARADDLAAKKVDIVGCSLGGLVTKLYGGAANIRTVTTVGTPHYGSPLADILWSLVDEADQKKHEKFFADLLARSGHPATNGAVKDLRTDGGKHCDANNIDVPINVIIGVSPLTDPGAIGFVRLLAGIIRFCRVYSPKFLPLPSDWFTGPVLLADDILKLNQAIFNSEKNDWVVSESSQKGGCTGAVYDNVLWHMSETHDEEVLKKIIDFLHSTGLSKTADQKTPTGKEIAKISPPLELSLEIGKSAGRVKITQPTGGQVFHPGDTVDVAISISNENAAVLIATSTDESMFLDKAPYRFQFKVPNDMSGSLTIIAGAGDKNGFIGSDEVAINIVTSSKVLEVTSPNGGEVWNVGAKKAITWKSPGTIQKMNIAYSIDSGAAWVTIDSTAAENGSYSWTVPDTPSSRCLVKISASDGSAADSSDAVFTIKTATGAPPVGSFDSPKEGAKVSGSIPVTGWAIDDIGVSYVKIYCKDKGKSIYLGEAIFVEGARPDIENAFPNFPSNSKAGWGYMLLTHFLPAGGNGTYKLQAVAQDVEGNQVILGTKTINCDNAHAVKPFGAIDTPAQGGTASGKNFINWGWALTPPPNNIPQNGSTINVYIDGVKIGRPVYNIYREDIARLFPGYTNSKGAVGYFTIDTAAYENGVHTIYWTVVDNAGNTDGIGSRYFTIQNTIDDKAKL